MVIYHNVNPSVIEKVDSLIFVDKVVKTLRDLLKYQETLSFQADQVYVVYRIFRFLSLDACNDILQHEEFKNVVLLKIDTFRTKFTNESELDNEYVYLTEKMDRLEGKILNF